MTSLAGRMAGIDAKLFDKLGETAVIEGEEVKGVFHKGYREIQTRDGIVVGLDLSFDCQYQSFMNNLTTASTLTVEGDTYRFLRQIPEGGDESGLVILELGSVT